MVHLSSRRGKTYAVKKPPVVYRSGAVCFVLSPSDSMQLVQFFSLLMKIDQRLQQTSKASKARDDNPQKIKLSKTKGSHLSGPYLFLSFIKKIIINILINQHQPTLVAPQRLPTHD